MTLKKLLLSSLVLGSLITSSQGVQAHQVDEVVKVQVKGTSLQLHYLDSLPKEGKIQYAIWSEEEGREHSVFYDWQDLITEFEFYDKHAFTTYHLDIYLVQGSDKVLLQTQTFKHLAPDGEIHLDKQVQTDSTQANTSSSMPQEPVTNAISKKSDLSTEVLPKKELNTILTSENINSTDKVLSSDINVDRASSEISKKETTSESLNISPTIAVHTRSATTERSANLSSVQIIPTFNRTSFSVKVTGITDNPVEVLLPVWTEKNGQDDIKWYNMTKQYDGSYAVDIPIKNHSYETGLYHMHLYKRSQAGEALVGLGLTTAQATLPKPVNSPKTAQFSLSNLNAKSGTYTLTIEPEKAIKSIDVAVWSTSNQSNIKWYNLSSNSANFYQLNITTANHQHLAGLYNNHIYINYADGTRTGYVAASADLRQTTGITNSSQPASYNPTATGRFLKTGVYELSLNNAETGEYVFAVWSDKNGQDDISWYNATPSSTNSYNYHLDLAKHKDSGTYHFHVYKRTSTGLTGVLPTSFTVNPNHLIATTSQVVPSIPQTYVSTAYPIGQCTWGAKQVAPWIGEWWGNAKDWATVAKNLGYSVGETPRVGAVAVWPTDGNGYGHVAVVTHVESSSRIQVLESNYAGKQYIGNFRGWFNPNQVWNGRGYSPGPVYYIYPKS